jgi:hypothetical protein
MEFFNNFNIKKAFTHNFWLKLVSLAIATLVWFYVVSSITAGGSST